MQGSYSFCKSLKVNSKHIAENVREITYQIRPGLPGTFPDFMGGLKSSVLAPRNIRFGTPKIPDFFFQILKIRYF